MTYTMNKSIMVNDMFYKYILDTHCHCQQLHKSFAIKESIKNVCLFQDLSRML